MSFMVKQCPIVWGILVFLGAVCLGGAAEAQASDSEEVYEDYEDLWDAGEYVRALTALEKIIEEQSRRYQKWIYRRAKLRFHVGRVDEAITDMEDLSDRSPSPWYFLETALMHKYVGHLDEYDQWIEKSIPLLRDQRWMYTNRSENVASVGRLYEILGNNPKSILGTHFTPLLDGSRITLSAPAYIGAGDVAFRSGGYSIAAKYYEQALEKDDTNQEALAGLADCYWKSNDSRLTETIERITSVNPNHPRVHAILVSKHLELGETEQALAAIESMLAINPVDTQFLSFRAVVEYLEDDVDGLDRTVEEVLDFNPVCSDLYQYLGQFASRHYRFKDGAAFQRSALELDPDNRRARENYSLDLLRLGQEEEGRAQLDQVFEDNPYSVMAFNLLELMDTLATFDVVERGDFVLKLPVSESPIMAGTSLDLLDEAMVEFEEKYGVAIEKPVLIEMFDNHDDFMVRSVGLPGNVGHMGICFGKLITMDTPSVRPTGSFNWRSVLWHEFVHVITLQKTKNLMPRWLSEGISVYEEGVYSQSFHNRLDPSHLKVLLADGKPTVSDLHLLFTKTPSADHLMFGYFMSGEFVQFYVEAYGFDALRDALDLIAQKESAEAALMTAAAVDMGALNKGFHAYLDVQLKPYEAIYGKVLEDHSLRAMLTEGFKIEGLESPEEERDELAEQAKNAPHAVAMRRAEGFLKDEKYDEALEAFDEAFELFPDYDGEGAPLQQMAMIYKERQNETEFVETLERIVLTAPAELSATEELVRRYRKAGDTENMLRVAEWGLGIDPYSKEMHLAFLEGLVEQGHDARVLDELGLLLELDSGNWVDYRYQKSTVLARMKRVVEAKREVLTLLEEVPNYWKAQELLLELSKHDELPKLGSLVDLD